MTVAAPSGGALRLTEIVLRPWVTAIGFAVAFGILYWIVGPEERGGVWVPLAEAFVQGRLHLVEDRPWLELIEWADGVYHVPFPPVPAIILPAVALVGPQPWHSELSLYGARPCRAHVAGLAGPALLVAGFNAARFGSPLEWRSSWVPRRTWSGSGGGHINGHPWLGPHRIDPTRFDAQGGPQ